MTVKDKQQPFFVNIGSSSLLVIFLVLCLATFAILSLSSAKSDHTFSERLAAHKQAYYEASERAETIVGEIDRILYETASGIDQTGLHDPDISGEAEKGLAAYFTGVGEAVHEMQVDGIVLQVQQMEGECMISFQVPAGERQALSVTLAVTDYRAHDNYYEVRAWKIVNTESTAKEQPLKLLPVIQE